jgi:hypothetical protein
VGLKDKVKQGAGVARAKIEESREAGAARAASAQEAQAAREAEAAERERDRLDQRTQRFAQVQSACPFPIQAEQVKLPGGVTLFDDEFLVTVGKDWGWSSQKMSVTTQRVIVSRGRLAKDQESVYLTDIRDVRFRKPLVGFGTLVLETAGGKSIDGLPSVSDGAGVRDRLLTLIHFARAQAQSPGVASTSGPVEAPAEDIALKLKQLGELKESGVVTAEEFEAKKAELLARM